MAELTIRPEEIRDALERFVEDYEPGTASTEEVGAVVECGDGIARVSGLPSVMANELLEFEDGTRGIALNLDVREIGVVVLGEFSQIEEGQRVKRTGEVLSVPVGDGFLGRVVGPLGDPLDGLGPIEGHTRGAAAGAAGPDGGAAQAGDRAAADRHQGHRRHDPGRPRAARADHRRPADRQDHDRHRHDPEPEAELGLRRSGPAGALHLRGDRPEGLDDLGRARRRWRTRARSSTPRS